MSRPSGEAEKAAEVFASQLTDFFGLHTSQVGDLPGDFGHKGRLVPLATVGNWGEVRRVGFDEYAVQRHDAGRVADVLRLRVGNVAGERNHKTEVERCACLFHGTAEAMHHTSEAARRPVVAK